MTLLRLTAALLLLKSANCLLQASNWAVAYGRHFRALADGHVSKTPMHPAERILLASIVGTAICALWIGFTWRAFG